MGGPWGLGKFIHILPGVGRRNESPEGLPVLGTVGLILLLENQARKALSAQKQLCGLLTKETGPGQGERGLHLSTSSSI